MTKFDLLTPKYLAAAVAEPALKFFKKKHGANGLKIEQPFSAKVNWAPTFQLKSAAAELTLVEVYETLYPAIFKLSYASILTEEATRAIKVYQACPLSSYRDSKHPELARQLKAHGFGLVTVDDDGNVDEQFPAAVIIHLVPKSKFDESVKNLPADVKSSLSKSFDVYNTDAKQGLQHSGQVVEALIHLIAEYSHKQGWLTSYAARDNAADLIDKLYAAPAQKLSGQRASLGGARQFMKIDRNASSHPAKSKLQAKAKIMGIREGFEQSLRVCSELCKTRKHIGLTKKIAL